MKRSICLMGVLCLVLALHGCSDPGPVKRSWGEMRGLEDIVGNMNDTSYSSVRSKSPRLNALGEPVAMADFDGDFIWAEYAAPWCKACSWQTPETQKAEQDTADDVVFLTIMTAKSEAYNDHATVDTAGSWAGRFGLDAERVLAAELWFKAVPEHRLYSPQGHTLFVHVGALSAEQIKQAISYYRPGWEEWSRSGTRAEWMTSR